MIEFARKPGLNSYWVTDHRYTTIAGRPVLEKLDVTGYGRFLPADLLGLWDLPFIKVFKDGKAWCALVGGNLQEGIAEFAPAAGEADLYDQITDHGMSFQRAHPGIGVPDKFTYWLPHEIEIMAAQARSLKAPR